MQKTILTLLSLLSILNTFGQRTEFRLALGSGFFWFTGSSAGTKTLMVFNEDSKDGYTYSDFGAQPRLSYGFSGNIKHETRWNLVSGLDLGYERLNSKVTVDKLDVHKGNEIDYYESTGKRITSYHFLNVHPFIGYRFVLSNVKLDLTGGFDLAYNLKERERAKVTAENGLTYEVTSNEKKLKKDVRPGVQIAAEKGTYGLFAAYSSGCKNYLFGVIGRNAEAYSRVFRIGLTYRLM